MSESLLQAVETIYAGVHQTGGWNRILETLQQVTGAGSGCIVASHSRNQAIGASVECFHNIDPEWIEAYNAHYCRYDPTPDIIESSPGQVRRDHVTGCRLGDLTGESRTFYHEVMRPQNFRHTLALGLSGGVELEAAVVLQRTQSQGGFEETAVDQLTRLSGHLGQALELHTRMSPAVGLHSAMAEALDNTTLALVLLDANGRPVFVNRQAKTLLAQHRCLDVSSKGILAMTPRENNVLQRVVNNALTTAAGRGVAGGGQVWIQNKLHVEVTPLIAGNEQIPFSASNSYVAIWLSTPELDIDVSAATLRECYDLTPAEADLLAWLVKGKTLAEIAALRATKFETARSQLKAIKAKLGVTRQADIVRTVLTGPIASQKKPNGAHR